MRDRRRRVRLPEPFSRLALSYAAASEPGGRVSPASVARATHVVAPEPRPGARAGRRARLTYARAPRGRMSASPATVTNFASRSSSVPRSPPSSRVSVLPRDRSMERVGAEHARASRVALEPGGCALLRCDERGMPRVNEREISSGGHRESE